jgi:Motility quorum-sensing regulator, toxin of MqsA
MVQNAAASPTYSLKDLQELVRNGTWELGTQRCRDSVRALDLLEQDAAKIVLQLVDSDFSKVFGYCGHDFGNEVLGDAYKICVDLDSRVRCAPDDGTWLYIKLAEFVLAGHRDKCLIISFHD